jgi:hypothetical protein
MDLTDHNISRVLLSDPVLLAAAKLPTERHGRVVSPGDLGSRVEALHKVREHPRASYGFSAVSVAR